MLLDVAGCLKPLHINATIIIYEDDKVHMPESVCNMSPSLSSKGNFLKMSYHQTQSAVRRFSNPEVLTPWPLDQH